MSKGKVTKMALDQQIIEALGAQPKGSMTVTLNGEVYKAKDMQQQLQAEVDTAKATQSAKTAWQQAVLAGKAAAKQAAALRKALRASLVVTYGAKSAIVADFGFTPKETTVDVATKAAANEKRKATIAAGGSKASRPTQETATAASPVAPVGASGPAHS